MPRYVAERTLLAPVADVWAFLAEPYHLSDWWPGLGGVQPDRRGVAAGARWKILGSDALSEDSLRPVFGPGMFRRPGAAGTLLILDAIPERKLSFQLVNENVMAELELAPVDADRTAVKLTVDASWGSVRRTYAKDALRRLYDLVQTGADI